jgi:hypothetical protein
MNAGMIGRRNPVSSAGSSGWPPAVSMTAYTSSSPSSDGTPMTATSLTAGCRRMNDSTSKEEMFSPRRRSASLTRSTK